MKKSSKKHNKYEQDTIAEDVFDFHDFGILTEHEIQNFAYDFLWKAHKRFLHKVRIITGKGLRSINGPVVKPVVEQYIRTLPFVKSFGPAKYNEGGTGAIDVILEHH